MFRQKYVVLVVFVAVMLMTLSAFAVDKASKDAILTELSALIDKNPDILRSVVYSVGDEYARENKTDEAVALYEKALKILPDNEDFLNRLGNLYNQKAEYVKAVEVYKKMIELNPGNTWYFNMLSDTYRNAGDKDKAAGVWEDLLQKTKNADVFVQAANFYSSENNMDKAIEAMKKAIGLAPDNVGYLQNLESFYVRAEKFAEAEDVCKKVLDSYKEQWSKNWANSELINIYQRQDKLEDLAVKFEKDLTAAPKEPDQYKKLADLYQRSDHRDKAIAVYEKAATAGVNDREMDNRLMDLYEWSEKFDEAEAQIDKIISAAPEESYLYERRANLLVRAGKQDEAKKAWKEFLAKIPNDAGLFSRYGDRLNEWGDADGAIEQYKKAQSLDPKNTWYSIRAADILIMNKRLKEAKVELKAVIAKATDDWTRQEVERRVSDIDARLKAVPAQAPETVVSEVKQAPEPKTEPKPEPQPKKKKRGWFGR
ncbi:tetratricopeptide repeat protein [Patescibacteria group bacterium]|nr:tetratricopeptide repeat protein [Patescibacteria group bacterium]